MKHTIITLIAVFITTFGFAQNTTEFFKASDAFFEEYVKDGKINYKAIKENPAQLEKILASTNSIKVAKSDANTYQAYWINIYNLTVIKGIIEKYPVKSPLDIAGFFDKTKHAVGGKEITLNDIENKLLRGQFNDARFHFVLVCAGLGCPPIIAEAYMPNTLDKQLDTQTRIALNNDEFIKVNAKKKRVQLSEIMKWYKEDFTQNGNEIDFINKYREEKIAEKSKISYYSYNWKLNEIK
ncbi:DUF547 domain-containing protein [Kordia sp. YSTF-M3]|uniref:DUF547 domain-containing protein n=1 Tax=Kordia aestuariivivens TaxID=2759037 RepID=A0ABR7QA72_9FLAO|nr:DUF547 domain-containing protein [Kordia aestuariivivens]MBC8755470.1 DUF547 domain-containing protein [Kordia aestuariivivens]